MNISGVKFSSLIEDNYGLNIHINELSNLSKESDSNYVLPLLDTELSEKSCSPPTPESNLNNYRRNIESHSRSVSNAINRIGARSLEMGEFARARNNFVRYFNSLPNDYCIGPSNRDEFNALQNSIRNGVSQIDRGIRIFEGNYSTYVNQAVPFLNTLYREASRINYSSRDYTSVLSALSQYNSFASGYNLKIWNLSQKIENLSSSLASALNPANNAFRRSLEQIEENVESESRRFMSENTAAENSFKEWENINGKTGYEKFRNIVVHLSQVMIPNFNSFLQRVPRTQRIQKAAGRAQEAVSHIESGFQAFPTFSKLPSSSTSFPYEKYGKDERKYGEQRLIDFLEGVCLTHFNDTGKKLYLGDMQLEHGGRISPHVSHKEGIDADIDPVEVGNVPNNNEELALAAAKRFLSGGARIVFYADEDVVNDANEWASENNISGRLKKEDGHTNHFHIRL